MLDRWVVGTISDSSTFAMYVSDKCAAHFPTNEAFIRHKIQFPLPSWPQRDLRSLGNIDRPFKLNHKRSDQLQADFYQLITSCLYCLRPVCSTHAASENSFSGESTLVMTLNSVTIPPYGTALVVDENHEVFNFGHIDKIMEERHENELIAIGGYSSWRRYT